MLPTDYVDRMKALLVGVDAGKFWLPSTITGIVGMSSKKVMALLNGSIKAAPGAVYLEVGVWKGKTFVSAVSGNSGIARHAYAVDNWSEFGGPRDEFHKNLRLAVNAPPITVIEKDCFALTEVDLPEPIDVYFYDGAHKQEDQRRALVHFRPRLADRVLFLVDDYNREFVRAGTQQGIVDGGFEVEWEMVRGQGKENDPQNWWCGFYAAVLRKR